jgi:Rieske Fe-S protein
MTHDHSDATCEGCPIGRRTFVSQATLAAAAALLAEACGTGVWEPLAPSGTTVAIPSSGLSFKLADYPALAAVGGVATVSAAAGVPLAIVRTGITTFVAVGLICPHQGTTVNASSSGFVCPNHGARFSTTGVWTGGQATANLTTYPVTYSSATGTLAAAATAPSAPAPVTTTPNGSSLVVTVANYAALASVGGIARVDGNSSRPIALARTGQSTFVALSMVCPHEGATIAIQTGGFTCPRHGAQFNSGGTWLGGQRTGNLAVLKSVYDAQKGTVTISL